MQVAGTEQGITEPEATFSACFGGAFLLWHPMKYASMLAEKMDQHGTNAWLVNTGWTGGRSALQYCLQIIKTLHDFAWKVCLDTIRWTSTVQTPGRFAQVGPLAGQLLDFVMSRHCIAECEMLTSLPERSIALSSTRRCFIAAWCDHIDAG